MRTMQLYVVVSEVTIRNEYNVINKTAIIKGIVEG